jgi:hypothetical protein
MLTVLSITITGEPGLEHAWRWSLQRIEGRRRYRSHRTNGAVLRARQAATRYILAPGRLSDHILCFGACAEWVAVGRDVVVEAGEVKG